MSKFVEARRWLLGFVLLAALASNSFGATTIVRIANFYFTPTNITIAAGDTVIWSNTVSTPHDTTQRPASGPALWASPLLSRSGTYAVTFSNAGFYPYVCQIHIANFPQQTGTVTVLTPNQLPVVSISSPANGAVFFAPASFPVTASATDSDGAVTNVQLSIDGVNFGQSNGPTLTATVSGLGVGTYSLRASARDNQGAESFSPRVNITVQEPPKFFVTVVASPPGGGLVGFNPPQPADGYTLGTVVTLTANPAAGFFFANWSGSTNTMQNPLVLVVDGPKNLTAGFSFEPHTLTLAISPPESGSIRVSPPPNGPNRTYLNGTEVTLTATPAPGFAFLNWSGSVGGASNVITFLISADTSVTANFTPLAVRSLMLNISPTNGGSVTASPPPNAPGGGYYDGTVVTLTASAAEGFYFTNWSGAVSNSDNPLVLTVGSDLVLTGNFEHVFVPPHTLTITVNPADSAPLLRVVPAPNGPGGTYVDGTVVTLEVSATSGYVFTNWTGAVNSESNSITVLMDADKAMTANFLTIPRYALTLTASPTNGGSLTALTPPNAPGGLYLEGTVVELVAVASADFLFKRWSGAIQETNQTPLLVPTTAITIQSNTAITAHFTRLYSLTITADPPGLGFIAVPSSMASGRRFEEGAVVMLAVVALDGAVFLGWSGDVVSTSHRLTVVMDTNKALTANFARLPVSFTLTLATNPPGAGTIHVNPPPRADGTYPGGGDSITFTAAPIGGFRFVRWSGTVPIDSTNNSLVITTDINPLFPQQHLNITAEFEAVPLVDFNTAAGTYAGLLMEEEQLNFITSGFVSLRVTAKGNFRGTARIGGGRDLITGKFDRYGATTVRLRRGSLTGVLQLDPFAPRLTGTLTDGARTSALLLYRGRATNAAEFAGSYPLVFDPVAPVSHTGTATLRIAADGSVRVQGALGDGTKFTSDSVLTPGGRVAVFAPLYQRRGAIIGWMDGGARDALQWFRPADSRSRGYPEGFALELPVASPRAE